MRDGWKAGKVGKPDCANRWNEHAGVRRCEIEFFADRKEIHMYTKYTVTRETLGDLT